MFTNTHTLAEQAVDKFWHHSRSADTIVNLAFEWAKKKIASKVIQNYKSKSNRNVIDLAHRISNSVKGSNGMLFQYIIGEVLERFGGEVTYEKKDRRGHVDIFWRGTKIDCKTSYRERLKQALFEHGRSNVFFVSTEAPADSIFDIVNPDTHHFVSINGDDGTISLDDMINSID